MIRNRKNNRKGYILANAVLLVFFLMLICQIVMQNVVVASYQARLFQKETQDKLDVKTGVYRAISSINNNLATVDTSLPDGSNLVITITGNNDEKTITVSKNNLKAIVSLYCTKLNLQPASLSSYQWIIYKWVWVP